MPATVAPPRTKPKQRDAGPGSGLGRPWLVIVKNDDHNTFDGVAFAAGLTLIGLALLSPLEHIALTSLVSFHLVQNVILADWAPPLLVLGLTPAMMAVAERRAWLRGLTAPPVALAVWLASWYV